MYLLWGWLLLCCVASEELEDGGDFCEGMNGFGSSGAGAASSGAGQKRGAGAGLTIGAAESGSGSNAISGQKIRVKGRRVSNSTGSTLLRSASMMEVARMGGDLRRTASSPSMVSDVDERRSEILEQMKPLRPRDVSRKMWMMVKPKASPRGTTRIIISPDELPKRFRHLHVRWWMPVLATVLLLPLALYMSGIFGEIQSMLQ